jgi:hypothetical protein
MLDEATRAKKKFTLEEITAINDSVAVPPTAPGKFYLGEKADPENKSRVILEYSSPKMYELKK